MKKRHLIIQLIFMLIVFIIPACSPAENVILDTLMSGTAESGLSVSFTSPEYRSLAQYGEERLEPLNRLLKHLSVEFNINDQLSETVINIDQEPVFSIFESTENNQTQRKYSFEPDLVIEDETEEEQINSSYFSCFLDQHFFTTNRLLDELFLLFHKTADAFADIAKTDTVSLSFKKIGKAVRRVTIRFSADFVSNHFPRVLSELSDSEECRQFIGQFVYDGSQKIVLLYDADNNLIRISYDGTAGLSEESLRRVSVNWRCLRKQDHKIDDLTIKTPAVKGYDKYNLIYSRELDLTDSDHHAVAWNYELDLKAGDLRQKIQFKNEMSYEEEILKGKVLFTQKEDGREVKKTIIPSVRKENNGEYEGSLEITDYSGKIITSRIQTGIRLSSGRKLSMPESDSARVVFQDSPERKKTEEELQTKIENILLNRLMLLPKEDLDFFSRDIPDDIWSTITQSIH